MILNPTTWPSHVSFQGSLWVGPVPTSLGQVPSCLSSELGVGFLHSPLMVLWPGCLSGSPTDRSILKEVTVIYKAIVHYMWKGSTSVMNDWVMEHNFFFPWQLKKMLKWDVETALENISAFSKNHKPIITAQPSNFTSRYLPTSQRMKTHAHEKSYMQIFSHISHNIPKQGTT